MKAHIESRGQRRFRLGLIVAGILLVLAAVLGAQQAFGAAVITAGNSSSTCMSGYYAGKIAQGGDAPTSCAPLWQTVTYPAAGSLNGIAAISANDVYVAATGGLLHWDGSAWTMIRAGLYTAVAALASNDVWVWNDYVGPVHWNGSTWTDVPAPDSDIAFDAIAIGDSSHVWAGGLSDFRGSFSPVILYWNGATWTEVTCCSTANSQGLNGSNPPSLKGIARPGGGGCEPYNHVTGAVATTAHDAWLVGTSGSGYPCSTSDPHFYHIVDGAMQSCCTAIPADVAMGRAGASDFWAVGTGTAHYAGGTTWTTVASPSIGVLSGVSGSSPTDVWAVGTGGFLHYNGSYWTTVNTNGQGAKAVSVLSTLDAWAIADSTILHYQGTSFTDVALENTFYGNITCLYCRGIMSGYPCGGTNPQTGAPEPCDAASHPYFRYNNTISRGQISKLVANSAGFNEAPGPQVFEDVPPGSTFYDFINRLANRTIMSGYPCGGPGEPCVAPANRPYFRPGQNALRAQLCKIVSNAAGFSEAHSEVGFQDVPTSSPFYIYVQRLVSRSVLGGYPCGGAGEPCVPPANLPYFRPANLVSRGQSARITGNAFFPGCASAKLASGTTP